MSEGNLDYAMRRYNQSWLLNPNNYQPYWGFGRILLQQIDELVALAEPLRTHPQRQPALEAGVRTLIIRWAREHGCDLPEDALRDLLELDVALNAQGIATWLDRRH